MARRPNEAVANAPLKTLVGHNSAPYEKRKEPSGTAFKFGVP